VIARWHGISVTEVRISETAEKTFATAEKMLEIVVGIGVTVEKTFATAEKIIRIAGETDATIEEISRVTGETDATIEEISRVTGDSGLITKGISERIMEFDGTTKDIIPQWQIAGTDTLLNVTDMHIPADLTEAEAGAKFTDVRFNKYCQGNKLLAEVSILF
jgi:methyl-accepting chemotaxis protein